MKLQLLKNGLKGMLKDEKGATVSAESLIVIIGSSLVAAAVVGVVTFMLVGTSQGGSSGSTGDENSIVGKVTKKINDATDSIIDHEGGDFWN